MAQGIHASKYDPFHGSRNLTDTVFVEIVEKDKGKSSSIKIFLSHAKSGNTGRLHAEAIKRFIDNTNMSLFFDATTISPGFKVQ